MYSRIEVESTTGESNVSLPLSGSITLVLVASVQKIFLIPFLILGFLLSPAHGFLLSQIYLRSTFIIVIHVSLHIYVSFHLVERTFEGKSQISFVLITLASSMVSAIYSLL